MKTHRFGQEQIIGVLREWSAGTAVADLVRRHGVTEQTLYRWKKRYNGALPSEETRVKALEEENAQLRRLVVDQALKLQIVNDLLAKRR